MPRQPRFWYAGAVLHVVQRGNNRAATFAEDRDRHFYLVSLRDACQAHGIAIHAYVLMTNHIHLLASPASEASLPRAMQAHGRRYVAHFNRRYGRTGGLWEGRYRATLVDSDAYLLACMRYVELNPVRAGIVRSPGEFRWSSYGANALGIHDSLVVPHSIYVGLARDDRGRRRSYRAWCDQAAPPEEIDTIREATRFQWVLGSSSYCEYAEAATGRRSRRSRSGPRPPMPASAAADN